MSVERHLEHRCRAAARSGARSGGETFPLGATRFVEMNMGVDDARQNDQSGRVNFFRGRTAEVFAERDDPSIRDSDVRLGTDDKIEVRHGGNGESNPNDEAAKPRAVQSYLSFDILSSFVIGHSSFRYRSPNPQATYPSVGVDI